MESLFDKLRALGVQIGKENLAIRLAPHYSVEKVIEGEWLDDQQRSIFFTINSYPVGYTHGIRKIETEIPYSRIFQLSKIDDRSINLKDMLFIDAETTSLSGGSGTMVFMIGLGFFDDSSFIVNQYYLDNPNDEFSFIMRLEAEFSKFKILLSYNGSSFDLPLLKTRFRLNRVDIPFQNIQHLDLLHLSRKLWKLRLPSCRLRDIESEILYFERAEEEIPSWMVPQIYFEYLHTNDARPLKGVFYHNRMDVLSLAALFIHISDLLIQPDENIQIENLDLLSIARLFENKGFFNESATLYELCIKNGLPDDIKPKTLYNFGKLCKRIGLSNSALEMWKIAFQEGFIESGIEIAKFYEHQTREYNIAYEWVEKSIQKLKQVSSDTNGFYLLERGLDKRKDRLMKKIDSTKL